MKGFAPFEGRKVVMSQAQALPDSPNLDWLRKESKRRLVELRASDPLAKLADAQFALAKEYGFPSWRALKAHIDSLTIDGQLIEAARSGDAATLATLLDAYPEKLHLRTKPYNGTLLHAGAQHLPVVDLLLKQGLDVNAREAGDNTYAMHWAAAAGKLDVVRRLADAGGDVIGHGDDHDLEVIGWASCSDEGDPDARRKVVEFLLSRGARHHIFSAIAMNDADPVRRLVAADPSVLNKRQSRNENHRTPLHSAVAMNRPQMVALLIELGADPLAVDGFGLPAPAYARDPNIDRPILEKIRAMTAGELRSADRGRRPARGIALDLMALLSLGDMQSAERLHRDDPRTSQGGVLHLMAKRGDLPAAKWLLDHGADPNGRWAHFDSEVTPLHLAILGNHPQIARLLLDSGADPTIRDSKHDGDAFSWARHFGRPDIIEMLNARNLRT
jgi:ankyrin repeat protein